MKELLIVIALVGLLVITGCLAACVLAAEEDRRMERDLKYDKSCNYKNCPNDCSKCNE